jgi:hypothetical protein
MIKNGSTIKNEEDYISFNKVLKLLGQNITMPSYSDMQEHS